MPTLSDVLARRILLVEDEALTRSLLIDALTAMGFQVRGVDTALAGSRELARFDPDALLVDLDLGDGPGGMQLLLAARRESPTLPIVILSNFGVGRDAARTLPSDVIRLDKRQLDDPAVLIRALDAAMVGGEVAGSPTATPLDRLTPRQTEVLRLIAAGLSNVEIAATCSLDVRGVETSIRRIYDTLEIRADDPGINARVEAARLYIRHAGMPSKPR